MRANKQVVIGGPRLNQYAVVYMLLAQLWLTACLSSRAVATIPSEPTATSAPTQPAVSPTPSHAASTTPVAPTATISPTQTPTATPTASPTPIVVGEPCGQQMPIVLPNDQSPLDWTIPPLPDDIIPADVLPALEQFFAQPDDVSLTVYQLGYEGIGFYHNADRPMPLASVSKLVQLVAYADAVEAGLLDPAQRVELAELNRYYLPRSDLGAHSRALRDLDSDNLTLDDVVTMMIQYSANSATDYLHALLGQAAIEETATALGLTQHSAVCPWIGRFLTMGNPIRTTPINTLATNPDQYAHEVIWLSEQYTSSDTFRADAQRYWSTRRVSIATQRAFVNQLETRGTTGEYASLMADLVTGRVGNAAIRDHLAWPMAQFASNRDRYATLGYKNGSFPGTLTTVYYAEPYWADTPIVVALFYHNLPNRTYQQWRRSFPHDDLAHWLMSNPNAIHIMHVLRDGAATR